MIYAGRAITGLGVGGIAASAPGYISEIAPPAIRGRLTGFFESFYQCGAVVGFWINCKSSLTEGSMQFMMADATF